MKKEQGTHICMVCGELRPEDKIAVVKKDVSEKHGVPPGTMFIDVRYCSDRNECKVGAESYSI